ncbi:hypothetical protein V6N13_134930 [Hibiscus sabdariffa]
MVWFFMFIWFDIIVVVVVGWSERETETLNRARQLVFGNGNLATPGHLEYVPSSYHPSDPNLSFRSVCPPRLFSSSSSTLLPPTLQPPPQPYLHPSPSRLGSSYPSQYPNHGINDYYVGHVLGINNNLSHSQHHHQHNLNYLGGSDTNYTCIGAPVGTVFSHGSTRGSDLVGPGRVGGAGFKDVQQQASNIWTSDHPSAIQFEDGL